MKRTSLEIRFLCQDYDSNNVNSRNNVWFLSFNWIEIMEGLSIGRIRLENDENTQNAQNLEIFNLMKRQIEWER